MPISATLVKTFTLATWYEVQDIAIVEFSKLPLNEKFEFIISKKIIDLAKLFK